MGYLESIKTAILFFPVIAFFVAIPFILIQYHKYGSVSFFKSLLTYSFVLYIICAYFLVILPLPDKEKVALITTPKIQLIPFNFIIDFIKNMPQTGFVSILKSMYFYMPLFNIFLTIPFGVYLRYFFEVNFKHTVLYTFLLSLFFEITQLSGLYFIYPRSYRLCDIDDLILNTIGGILGFLIIGLFMKKLPKLDKLNKDAREKGKKISGFKRTTAFFLDMFIYLNIVMFISVFIKTNLNYLYIIVFFIYYIIVPYLLKGSTIVQKYLNLKIVTIDQKNNFFRLLFRVSLFCIIYFVLPFLLFTIAYDLEMSSTANNLTVFVCVLCMGVVFLIYTITGIKYLFTNKSMLYEKISKTKMISTIE